MGFQMIDMWVLVCVFLVCLAAFMSLVIYKLFRKVEVIRLREEKLLELENKHLEDANYWMGRAQRYYERINYLEVYMAMVRDRTWAESKSDRFAEAYQRVYDSYTPDYSFLYTHGVEDLNLVVREFKLKG